MKKLLLLLLGILFIITARTQLLNISPGSDLTILYGKVFKADSLALTPSAFFVISNNTLNKSTTVIHTTTSDYISRVYQFTRNTNPVSGSVQINYTI